MDIVKFFLLSSAFAIPFCLLLFSEPAQASQIESHAEIVIAATPEKIWSLLTEIQDWPKWNPAVDSVIFDGEVKSGNSFQWKSGGFSVTSTLQIVHPGKQLTWTGVAIGTRAFHSWDIEDTEAGVTVSTYETFDGWLPRLLSTPIKKSLDKTLQRWLTNLKIEAEKHPPQ